MVFTIIKPRSSRSGERGPRDFTVLCFVSIYMLNICKGFGGSVKAKYVRIGSLINEVIVGS